MKTRHLLACLLAFPAALAFAAETYRCSLIVEGNGGAYRVDQSQYAELVLEPQPMPTLIHLESASTDLRFKGCAPTPADGSNFSGWFGTQCQEFVSLDGKSFTVDGFPNGAYAGISPPIKPGYVLYEALAKVGAQVGTGTPERTFVIYSDRRPRHEFFCYRASAKPRS